ncbi:MAG: hypothetical protein HY293_14085, partial [Planctomycetes bacterium]|nr:hypothetical protein [Planctomycetota bacterium]
LAVVRSGPAVPAGTLSLNVAGDDGSRMSFSFPVSKGEGRATEHLRLNGRLLRPGRYSVEVSVEGSKATKEIELYSHVRQSPFRIIDWSSRAKGAEQAAMGADSLGFNLLYASYGGLAADDSIRAGLDYLWCCTMGGGHQMDLRMECDWSDPYALQGGIARAANRAFRDRTHSNAVGVHFYDEPGLTWWKHAKTGEMTPHNIPAQDRAYRSAFGREPLVYNEVKANNPDEIARWTEGGRWKLGFMDAACKQAQYGVSRVREDFLSVNQSVYGWGAYGDGYYFNVVRSLPVLSGHGGYDDFGGGYYNPLYTFEMGRIRELRKPNWYLPTWYGNIPSERYRLEQYSSFIMHLQGMAKPPDIQVHRPSSTPSSDGVVETNKLMARLGTVFTTAPVSRPAAAVLYSMSQNLHAQIQSPNRTDNYEGGGHGRDRVNLVWLAGLRMQTPILPIVEEDVLDGTLAANHRAVILTGIQSLDPKVIAALEAYAAKGGAVIVGDECPIQIQGSTRLDIPVDRTFFEEMSRAWKENRKEDHAKLNRAGNYLKAAEPVAKALKPKLEAAGITPVMACDNPEIIASRQSLGDIDYVFAVNASYDEAAGGMNSIRPAQATIQIPGTLYDAVRGGPGETGALRFGPGQMRAWAKTSKPIGGIQALPAAVFNDTTLAKDPIRVEIGAILLDADKRVLAGSAPLRVRLIDPLGATRYDLYRATERGLFRAALPLAANDPSGEWKVVIGELLANSEDSVKFNYSPPSSFGALAGTVSRALTFGNDRDNVFRFFRTHQDVTLVSGKGDYAAASARLAEILKPWGVRVKTMALEEAAKPRTILPEEAATWCGLHPGKAVAGDKTGPAQAGFAVQGPVVLLGTPEDHAILKFALDNGFLPYTPHRTDFPGRGRGMIAWQRDGVGLGQESVALIAYDAEGLSEAVGSLYEIAAGIEPLMALVPPATASVNAANKAPAKIEEPATAWKTALPDRAVWVKPSGKLLLALTQDGSLTALDEKGAVAWQRTFEAGETITGDLSDSLIVVGTTHRVLGFDAAGKPRFDVPAPSVTCVAVSPDGTSIAFGRADGTLSLGDAEGKVSATLGGGDAKNPKPFLAAMFVNDGKTLVALTAQEAHVIAEGKIAQRIGGVAGRVAPLRRGDAILLSDGNEKVLVFAGGKIAAQIAVSKGGVVGLSGGAVATELDGGVRFLKDGKVAWEHKALRKLTKRVAARGDRVAVAYWGGALAVLEGGAVKAAQTFPYDVADLAWSGDRLVVGLADGRLFGLDVK